MIALKVLVTFCLATFCLASPATLTENEDQIELLKDAISKMSETIPEIEAQLLNDGWTQEELNTDELAPEGKGKFLIKCGLDKE